MTIGEHECYQALLRRDPHYDGRFFVCVKTTGIFCRPVCAARKPKFENCEFVGTAGEASARGFRPCKRCRPETAKGSPAWKGTGASVSRALRLLGEEPSGEMTLGALAEKLGMGERHLRRLFNEHLGLSPSAVLKTRRLNLARQLLLETELTVARIAFASGYGSIRRFNDAFRRQFGTTPTRYRKDHVIKRRISA